MEVATCRSFQGNPELSHHCECPAADASKETTISVSSDRRRKYGWIIPTQEKNNQLPSPLAHCPLQKRAMLR